MISDLEALRDRWRSEKNSPIAGISAKICALELDAIIQRMKVQPGERAEFEMAVRVCMAQRGEIAFLHEYLPDGIFHKDTLAALASGKP